MPDERDDVLSYNEDRRELQGPVHRRHVDDALPFAAYFILGYCPKCADRLSWNRTCCFEDELEDQCAECLVVWEWEPADG